MERMGFGIPTMRGLRQRRSCARLRQRKKDWYVAFSADYVSGHAVSDHNENSEVLWLDIDEALTREDVPDLTKKLIQCALHKENGFVQIPYDGTRRYGEYSFYGISF